MSAPPPAGNPDRRPLPDGWITRYDENYRAWYYVDTRAQPPRSSWDHPHGTLPPSSPPGYAPPPNPPSRNYGNSASSPSFNQQQGQPYPVNQAQSYPGVFQGNPQEARAYSQQGFPPQQGYGAPANYGNQGWQQGWQQPQQAPLGYAQPPPQAIQQPARSGRSGMGTALLAGGGGLVAGALIGEAFENHEDREREEAYDQGYGDGQDGDFGGGGGDFGGGDW